MCELDSADSLRLCEKLVSWGPTCRGRLAAEPWRPLQDAIATAKRGPPFSLVALRPDARWLAARGSGPEAGAAVPRRAGGGSRPRRLLSTTDCSVPRTSGRRGESGRRTGGNGAGFVTAEHRGERAGHTVSCKLCFSTKMTPWRHWLAPHASYWQGPSLCKPFPCVFLHRKLVKPEVSNYNEISTFRDQVYH